MFLCEFPYSNAGDVTGLTTAATDSAYASEYDGPHRLIRETSSGTETLSWEYDGLGNRTAMKVVDG